MNPTFQIKQLGKMWMQNSHMPNLYKKALKKHPNIQKGLVLFADNYTPKGKIPFSMKRMYDTLRAGGHYKTEKWFADFSAMSNSVKMMWIQRFMERFAQAEYVFICSNFLPVSSCEKRPETKVIQLWHSGGLLKKCGYDTEEDIPKGYKGEVYKNYDLFTVSAPCCVPVLQKATHQPDGVVKALGVSRTDVYFEDLWNERNRREFYEKYREAHGKKIILWAPTFRGNASNPTICGVEDIQKAIGLTSDEYFWIVKLHPHLEGKGYYSNCDIPCEKLLGLCDLFITDYSSTLLDYILYKKPFVLFAPDLEEFERKRGFYVDYNSFPSTIAKNADELIKAIDYEMSYRSTEDLEECRDYHMQLCDGNATNRILEELGIRYE